MDNISSIAKANAPLAGISSEPVKETEAKAAESKYDNSFNPETELDQPSLTVEEIDYAVEVINETMSMFNRSLSFQVDDANGRTVIKIMDSETDELIKQIPSEDMLKIISHMQEMQSLLAGEQV